MPKLLKCRSSSSLDRTYSNENVFQRTLRLYSRLIHIMCVCRKDSGSESYFVCSELMVFQSEIFCWLVIGLHLVNKICSCSFTSSILVLFYNLPVSIYILFEENKPRHFTTLSFDHHSSRILSYWSRLSFVSSFTNLIIIIYSGYPLHRSVFQWGPAEIMYNTMRYD